MDDLNARRVAGSKSKSKSKAVGGKRWCLLNEGDDLMCNLSPQLIGAFLQLFNIVEVRTLAVLAPESGLQHVPRHCEQTRHNVLRDDPVLYDNQFGFTGIP